MKDANGVVIPLRPIDWPTTIPVQEFLSLGIYELMKAVLEDGIDCFMKGFRKSTRERRISKEAEAWIWGKQDPSYIFSFDNVCAVVGVEADYLRRGLAKWRREHY